MTDSSVPVSPRPRKRLWLVVGVVFLLITVAAILTSTLTMEKFSAEEGVHVSANKNYYLLVDEEALSVSQCSLEFSDGRPASQSISDIEPLINDKLEVRDVSMPLTSRKGIYARIQFTEDLDNVRFTCDKGNIYISTFNETTLKALRWVTIAGVILTVLSLLAWLFSRRRPADARGTSTGQQATTGAHATTEPEAPILTDLSSTESQLPNTDAPTSNGHYAGHDSLEGRSQGNNPYLRNTDASHQATGDADTATKSSNNPTPTDPPTHG